MREIVKERINKIFDNGDSISVEICTNTSRYSINFKGDVSVSNKIDSMKVIRSWITKSIRRNDSKVRMSETITHSTSLKHLLGLIEMEGFEKEKAKNRKKVDNKFKRIKVRGKVTDIGVDEFRII